MALSKDISLVDNFGETVNFTKVYIKVESVDANKERAFGNFSIYKKEGGVLLESRQIEFAPDMAGGNFIAQCYEAMKALSEFDGAKDC